MIWGFTRGLIKVVVALLVVVVVSAVVAYAWIEMSCAPTATAASSPPTAIDEPNYTRTEADTYFNFPEWYIVYSFDEFGRHLETASESGFPYLQEIAGYWQGFCTVNRIANGMPGDHGGYKQMLYVIGLSFTVELAIKGAYENTIGRLTEWLRGPSPTAEDDYARKVVQDYAVFLRQVPWYRYPFMSTMSGLWNETPVVGTSPVRNLERKVSLSAEYLVKAGYAQAIAALLAAMESTDALEIMFVVRGDAGTILASEPTVRLVRQLPDGDSLLVAPRYQAFTDLLKRLADRGSEVLEIAGNRRIMLTAIVPDSTEVAVSGARELFAMPLSARPGFQRIGYDVDIPQLTPVLRDFTGQRIEVERIYDY
jgi:hypothetical protein